MSSRWTHSCPAVVEQKLGKRRDVLLATWVPLNYPNLYGCMYMCLSILLLNKDHKLILQIYIVIYIYTYYKLYLYIVYIYIYLCCFDWLLLCSCYVLLCQPSQSCRLYPFSTHSRTGKYSETGLLHQKSAGKMHFRRMQIKVNIQATPTVAGMKQVM